jgi:L-fucose isomerase-like protein
MGKLRIAFIPIARKTFDIEFANIVTKAARDHLVEADLDLIGSIELITDLELAKGVVEGLEAQPIDLVVIFQATFTDSTMLMFFAEALDAPLFLWAVPEDHTGGRLRLNSFCGINLGAHALKRAGYRYAHIFATPTDPIVLEQIVPLAKAGRAKRLLRQAKLGRLGDNPTGFETCLLNPNLIKKRFGIDVVQFDLEREVFPQAQKVGSKKLDQLYAELDQRVVGLHELDQESTRKSLSVYATLKKIAFQEKLQGFAVRCWPEFFTELGCAACGAMSLLSDEMIPCSCEADVNGTITQMLLQSISGEPAFGTDMVSMDAELDALVVWHCGLAPISMADPEKKVGVTIHSNRKLPLLFEFTLKPGRITVARLTESSGQYRLVVGNGQVLRAPKSFSGTSGLIQFDAPANEILNTIIGEGLEHHISLTYGDHIPALLAFADLLDIQVLSLNNLHQD